MSHPSDPKRDELADRLMDQALGELLSGERPPDLSQKILAAVEEPVSVSPQRKESRMKVSTQRLLAVLLSLAACLVIGVVLLRPSVQTAREVARNGAPAKTTPAPTAPAPSAYHLDDDVEYSPPPPDFDFSREVAKLREAREAAKAQGDEKPPLTVQSPPAEARYELSARRKDSYSAPMAPSLPTKPAGEDSLRMMVTPRIIVQEEEEERLGLSLDQGSAVGGQGPGMGGDKYGHLIESGFQTVQDHPLSTFSIDADTASYANVRRFLLQERQLPPPDAVRLEEMINYFDYSYAGPEGDVPFASHMAVAGCPWQPEHRLVRIALKGKEVSEKDRPASNLVFLLDVSGSMQSEDKLPLLKQGMKLLAQQMREQDHVAIVVYASQEGLVLPSTSGAQQPTILAALDRLEAGGSTNGGAGIALAYKTAQEHFIPKGINRVILCTDGDFNVGTTSQGDLVRMVEEKAHAGVFLSVLGFGRGNLNDATMQQIADKGNGNYAYIDTLGEARKVLVQQMGGTLMTIAKDVKIQVEFNPAQVAGYRLIGYEKRLLAAEDFNNDRKDAGEIGAGHTVTALYEIVPAGQKVNTSSVDPLKYQPAEAKPSESASKDLLTLKLRYKEPDGDTSKLLEFPLVDGGASFTQADPDFQFAAAVASFGMLLRDSQFKGTTSYDAVLEIAASAKGADAHGYRAELLEMVRRAKELGTRNEERGTRNEERGTRN